MIRNSSFFVFITENKDESKSQTVSYELCRCLPALVCCFRRYCCYSSYPWNQHINGLISFRYWHCRLLFHSQTPSSCFPRLLLLLHVRSSSIPCILQSQRLLTRGVHSPSTSRCHHCRSLLGNLLTYLIFCLDLKELIIATFIYLLLCILY